MNGLNRIFNDLGTWILGTRELGNMESISQLPMQDWHHTRLWQTGLELVKEIYAVTREFPSEERYALTSQLRRAATSILANFAEGFCRISPADKQHKYIIARSECAEVCAFLDMAISIGLLTNQRASHAKLLTDGVGKMLSGFVYSAEQLKRSP